MLTTFDAPKSVPEVREVFKAAGVTYINTFGGPVALADWKPYGNGIENRVRFRGIDWDARKLYEAGEAPAPFVLGIWTF